MLPALRPLALALLLVLAAPAPAPAVEIAWRWFSQLSVPNRGLPVFADLDADGVNEIVFATVIYGVPDSPAYGLSVLGQGDGGTLRRIASIPLPNQLFSLVPVRRPGQADSVLVTLGLPEPTRLLEFTGRDLQLLREVAVPERIRMRVVADIDADGELEILADTVTSQKSGLPLVLDYATGAVRWQGPEPTQEVVAAQLDADPALEIISRGDVGRVYDGATGQQEWAWPAGFGQSVVAGRFDTDPQVPGFAIQGSNAITVFRASPYSPLRELPGIDYGLTAFDADGDGRDELYATRQSHSDFVRVSPQDGAVQPLLPMVVYPAVPSMGRLQSGGSTVAALASADVSASQPGALTVFDLDAAQVRYQASITKAPWWPSAFARPQPAGPLLAASLIGRFEPDAQQYQVALELRDAATGEPSALRSSLFPQYSAEQDAGLMAADIDGVPGDEIVVLRVGASAAAVALLDGVTLQDRWRVGGLHTPLANARIRGWALVDRNQDGVQDIVLATSAGFNSGVRLVVLSGIDGAVLWQSVSLAEPAVTAFVGLLAGEIDAQPGREIVLALADGIYAFDAHSGLSTWVVKGSGQPFTDLVHWGSDDDCRIGVVDRGETLRLLSCADRGLLATIDLPPGSERVAPLDPEGRVLAAAAGGKLLVARNGGPFQPELTGLGALLTLNWPWAVRASPDALSVLLGSTLQVLRADLAGDRLFASGFEQSP